MDSTILAAVIGFISAMIGAVIGAWMAHFTTRRQIEALKQTTALQIRAETAHAEKLTRSSISVSKANSFMERFSSPGYMEIRDEVETFLSETLHLNDQEKMAVCILICQKNTRDRVRRFNRLHALSMLFGEIGVSFESGHLNSDGLAIFDRIIPYYWKKLEMFIRACHKHYEFPLDDTIPLTDQKLTLFTKFCYAYKEMVKNGLAKEPLSPNKASPSSI